MCSYAVRNCDSAELRMSVPVGMIGASPFGSFPRNTCSVLAGEVRAGSKPKGRNAKVRRGKATARKVSEVLTSIARLIRAVGVLVNALSKWFS